MLCFVMRLARVEGILLIIFALFINPFVIGFLFDVVGSLKGQIGFLIIVLFIELIFLILGLMLNVLLPKVIGLVF